MPTESQFRQKLVPALKRLGMKVIPYPGTMRGQTSTCDIWLGGMIRGMVWQGWIEFKGESTHMTDGQLAEQVDLHHKFINAYVVRFVGSKHHLELIYIDDAWRRDVMATIAMKYENDKGRVVYDWMKCGRALLYVIKHCYYNIEEN